MTSASLRSEGPTGVLIVEDQTAIRQMLATFIGAMAGFTVVGQAATPAEALRVAEETKPRVVVLDWMLLNGLGLEFLRSVRIDPPPHVLVFSANTTELAVREALTAGARGYLEKTASFEEFTGALATIARGEMYLGPAVARSVQRIVGNRTGNASEPRLTPREQDVLRHLAEGMSSKEIADRLNLSVRTVENHRANIVRRTGLRSVAQLTLHAVRLGLVEAPSESTGSEAPSQLQAPVNGGFSGYVEQPIDRTALALALKGAR